MSEKMKLFTKVLKAELEDLEEDIGSWSRFLDDKHRADKITEYVYLENAGFLRRELSSIKTLVADMEVNANQDHQSLEGIRDYFLQFFKAAVNRFQFPGAILAFTTRKVEKVYRYLSER